MKKLLSLVLVLGLSAVLGACAGDADDAVSPSPAESPAAPTTSP